MTSASRARTVSLAIDGMTCGHCVASVRRALESVPGTTVRDVRIGAAEVALDAATAPASLIAAVQDAGYDAALAAADASTSTPADPASSECGCCAPAPLSLARAREPGGSTCH